MWTPSVEPRPTVRLTWAYLHEPSPLAGICAARKRLRRQSAIRPPEQRIDGPLQFADHRPDPPSLGQPLPRTRLPVNPPGNIAGPRRMPATSAALTAGRKLLVNGRKLSENSRERSG